jgi:hypothetical protein
MSQKNFWEKNVPFPELDPCFEMGVVFDFRIFGKILNILPVWLAILSQVYLLFMSIRSIIQRILKEETEKPKILKIPSLKVFNDDWFLLQKFLEKKGNPLYSIKGDLDLYRAPIQSLGNLISVGGNLDLRGTPIKSLGNLQYVGGYLDLKKTPIKSLGNLQSVGGNLWLRYTPIESLGNLQSVDGGLDLEGTPISKKYSKEEIRQMIKVGEEIYF